MLLSSASTSSISKHGARGIALVVPRGGIIAPL